MKASGRSTPTAMTDPGSAYPMLARRAKQATIRTPAETETIGQHHSSDDGDEGGDGGKHERVEQEQVG